MTITTQQLQDTVDYYMDVAKTEADKLDKVNEFITRIWTGSSRVFINGDHRTELSANEVFKIINSPDQSHNGTFTVSSVTTNNVSQSIGAVNNERYGFRVGADVTSNLWAGSLVVIDSSTGNDGTYTVTDVEYDSTDTVSWIYVEEPVEDDTADGTLAHTGTRVTTDETFPGSNSSGGYLYYVEADATHHGDVHEAALKALQVKELMVS